MRTHSLGSARGYCDWLAPCLIAILAVMPASNLRGDELTPGSRLRLSVPSLGRAPVVGRLQSLDSQSLTLVVEGQPSPVVLSRQDVTRFDLSRGRRSRGKGALIGLGIGTAVGALAGIIHGSDPPGTFLAFSAAEYATGFALLGASVGAVVGLAVPPGERWETLPLDRVHAATASSSRRGAALAITVSF